jgi:type I restriction enzyme, S subunit
MVQLSFKQTKAEFMMRIASTLLFNQLVKANSRIVSVREITENIQYGYTEKASESEIGPKYVRITDLKDGRVNWDTVPYCKCDEPEQYLLKQNDLIFARTGATTGKTHLFRDVPPYAVFASYLIRVRPTKEINPEYLYYFFQSDLYWSQVSSHKEGSAQPNVNGQKLSVIELAITTEEIQNAVCKFLAVVRARQDGFNQELPELPQPLREQRRIVTHIESLAARVNDAQRLREEASIETESLLASNRFKVFFELEQKYPNEPLGKLIQMTSGENLNSQNLDDSFPYSVYGGGGYVGKYSEYLYEDSKIAIGRVGARCGCVYVTEPKSWITDNALVVTSFSQNLDMQYLVYALTYLDLRRQANQAAQPVVSQKGINPQKIPVPPLDEQRRIVAYLDGLQAKVNALRDLQSVSGEELSALMPSILDKAFKGEL